MTGVDHWNGQKGLITMKSLIGLVAERADSFDQARLIGDIELSIHGFEVVSNRVGADEQLLGNRRDA